MRKSAIAAIAGMVSLCIAFLCGRVAAETPSAIGNPFASFSSESIQADQATGAATLSVPITVPPGRHGVEPKLALVYSSQQPNGICGVGWDLPIGFIQRSTKDGVPDYGAQPFEYGSGVNGVLDSSSAMQGFGLSCGECDQQLKASRTMVANGTGNAAVYLRAGGYFKIGTTDGGSQIAYRDFGSCGGGEYDHNCSVPFTSVAGQTLYFEVHTRSVSVSYPGTNVVVDGIKNYSSVTIASNISLTTSDWNPATLAGGQLTIRCQGTVTINGTIDLTGKGYRGGAKGPGGAGAVGQQGESFSGVRANARAANFGGGGGGQNGGGGGGGYGSVGVPGNAADTNFAGAGGASYGDDNIATLYMGSGGGGGPSASSGAGGNGGGALKIIARNIILGPQAKILCNGASGGAGDFGGGGGSGGSIYLQAESVVVSTSAVISVASGGGGYGSVSYGGQGGGGRLRVVDKRQMDEFLVRFGGVNAELAGVASNEFRAKIEGSFARYDFNGSSWNVRDKSGTLHQFGSTSNTVLGATNGLFEWKLDRVQDPLGNYMTVDYTRDQGQLYPASIRYTGHAGTGATGVHQVVFLYDTNRPDIVSSYRSGELQLTARRLQEIQILVQNQMKWRYVLGYVASTNSQRSMLKSVTIYDDAGNSLPPKTFTYQQGGAL